MYLLQKPLWLGLVGFTEAAQVALPCNWDPKHDPSCASLWIVGSALPAKNLLILDSISFYCTDTSSLSTNLFCSKSNKPQCQKIVNMTQWQCTVEVKGAVTGITVQQHPIRTGYLCWYCSMKAVCGFLVCLIQGIAKLLEFPSSLYAWTNCNSHHCLYCIWVSIFSKVWWLVYAWFSGQANKQWEGLHESSSSSTSSDMSKSVSSSFKYLVYKEILQDKLPQGYGKSDDAWFNNIPFPVPKEERLLTQYGFTSSLQCKQRIDTKFEPKYFQEMEDILKEIYTHAFKSENEQNKVPKPDIQSLLPKFHFKSLDQQSTIDLCHCLPHLWYEKETKSSACDIQ